MKMFAPLKSNKGVTIIETVVALGLTSVLLTALMAMVITAINASDLSKARTIATNYANEGLEIARTQRDATDWTTFVANYNSGAGSAICSTCYVTAAGVLTGAVGSAASIAPYTRVVTFSDGGSGRVTVDVKVTWKYHSQTETVELVSYLTDWHL